MSFKIFILQLSGRLKQVETVEKQRKILQDDYFEFQKVDSSEELKKYLELEKEINSDEFKKKKTEIEALQFKGSKEYNQLKEFEVLTKKRAIKNYFKIFRSPELERFKKFKSSEKLAEYYQLFEYVREGQFDKDKKEILGQVFKGSVEEKHWIDFKKVEKKAGIKAFKELDKSDLLNKHEIFGKSEKLKNFVQLRNTPGKDKLKQKEYKSLKRDREIRSYFKFEESKKLKLYRETASSRMLKSYYELKAFVESENFKKQEAFLKDNKKFEKSEANKKYIRFKQLSSDPDIKFFLGFEKSSLYKNYLDVVESFDLKRYDELEELIGSKEFKERKSYLEDKKKWEKTEEFTRLDRYLAMKKLPHIVKYFKYKVTSVFDYLKTWEVVFEDDFLKPQLDAEKWATTSYMADKLLGDNYSLVGDNYVFTNGKNLKISGKLNIEVRKEKAAGKVWKMPAGFIPVEMDYTSGIISSWKSCWLEDGIIEAKIRFAPVKQIVSSIYLAGEQNMPRVNLLEMGNKNRLGVLTLNSGKANVDGMDISNLKKGWYIFTVVKQGNNFTWKINETEIITVQSTEMNTKLHLNASIIVVNDVPGSQLPAGFEIDWVKCYRKRLN
ncbi:MAG: glycoside hydrolase [Prolixibacteraceae bacterium]|nr:MAG: glycoside hydrolase [Prolixibacteraceae bacterium]